MGGLRQILRPAALQTLRGLRLLGWYHKAHGKREVSPVVAENRERGRKTEFQMYLPVRDS